MPRPLAVMVATMLLLAAPPLAAAQYYKWVDEDGVTHYTQNPPPESANATIEADAATLPASTPDAPPADAGGDGASGDDESEQAGEEGDDEGPKTVAQFCERMRAEEQKLASDRPVRTKQADGSLKPLEGEARQQRLQQVRGQIQQHCQGDDAGEG